MQLDELSLIESEEGRGRSIPEKKGRLSLTDLRLLASTLARLLRGGIPLLRALEIIQESTSKPSLKTILSQIADGIREGAGFSAALEKISGTFPEYYAQIIHAGEMSGTLDKVLEELARYLENQEAVKRKILEALAYPGFILMTGLATLGVLLKVVLPKLSAVYQDFGSELPLMTQCILGLSRMFLPALLILAFGLLAMFFLARRQKEILILFIYRLPIAGKFLRRLICIQFSRLLGLLLENGISILEAMDMTRRTFAGAFLQKDLQALKEDLAEGQGFGNCLKTCLWMDAVSRMLVISGEEAGRLPAALEQVARDTELQVESEIQWLMKLLEPALILAVGLIVGIVVIGTVLPIFEISGLVK